MKIRFLGMVVMGACFLAAGPARGQQNGGSRQIGDGATNQREVPPAAPRGTSQKAKLQAGPDLSAAKQLPEVQNPRAIQLDSAALSVLQSQRQAVDAEVMARAKLGVQPGKPELTGSSQTMASHNGQLLGGNSRSASTQASPGTTSQAARGSASVPVSNGGSGSSSKAGGGSINPPVSGSTNSKIGVLASNASGNLAITCATNPTMRILNVAGSPAPAVFTPLIAYDLYTVAGCSFGTSGPDAKAYIYKGGAFREGFQIQEWHDNWIKLSLDPKISGVLDQDDITLVIQRADGTQASKGGFKFHAVRAPAPLQLIPSRWAHLVTWSQDNKSFSPEYSSPALIDGKAAGPSAYVSRFVDGEKFDPHAQAPDQQYDSYDFSGLAPGWTAKSAQLKTFDITCSDKSQPFITTYYERFGTWRAQWDGNALHVYLADASCSSFDAAMPLVNKHNHTGSYYQLVVMAYGPRCTDPLTGKPDQQCIQRVQQGQQ